MAQQFGHVIMSGSELAPSMDAMSRVRPSAALRLIWLIYIHCTINIRHTRIILPGYGKRWGEYSQRCMLVRLQQYCKLMSQCSSHTLSQA